MVLSLDFQKLSALEMKQATYSECRHIRYNTMQGSKLLDLVELFN